MSEIIFRGVSKSLKVWVHGSYDQYRVKCYPAIYSVTRGKSYDIIPETLGQFVWKCDKYGHKIYTGDILKRTIHCSYMNDGRAFDILFTVPEIVELYGNTVYENDARTSIELWDTEFEIVGRVHDKEATNEYIDN